MAKKILVIEDEPDVVKLLEARLRTQGYIVVSAEDGEKGLELFTREAPDLVILDITLPKMSGFDVYSRLPSLKGGSSDTPVIMLTAHSDHESISKGMSLGVAAYVAKPYKSEVLLGIIKGILQE